MNSYSFKEVHIKHVVSEDSVRRLIDVALNDKGGSLYWAHLLKFEFPPNTIYDDFRHGKFKIGNWWVACLIPLHRGGGLILEENAADIRHTLTREKMLHGLDMMAQKYPRHFQNIIDGTVTPETGDIFLQCSLFDDIVFGK